jgi:hypothetical protein
MQNYLLKKKWRSKMNNDNRISEKLLMADGIDLTKMSDLACLTAENVINNESKRIGRIKRITKLAAAAVFIVAVLVGMNHMGLSIDGANVAWAQVVKNFQQVEYFHYNRISYYSDYPKLSDTGWYAYGKLYRHHKSSFEPCYIDDGQVSRGYDAHGNLIKYCNSRLKTAKSPIDAITRMDWLYDFMAAKIAQQQPETISEDYLIYTFDVPEELNKEYGIARLSFMVGKTTLLPLQLKIYGSGDTDYRGYSLIIFDYDQPPRADDFFLPPTEKILSHGYGRVVLGGEQVEIELEGVPYLKKVVARLEPTVHDGPIGRNSDKEAYELTGAATHYLDVSFLTEDGTAVLEFDDHPVMLNIGSKSSNGRTFPDGTKRYMTTVLLLKPTDKEGEFVLEANCWLTGANPYHRNK